MVPLPPKVSVWAMRPLWRDLILRVWGADPLLCGYEVTWWGVDGEGNLELGVLRDAIREDTALVSMMWVNNETGVIFPVEEIAQIAREKGVFLHTERCHTPSLPDAPPQLRRSPARQAQKQFPSRRGHENP
jgi:hypothetical protein